MKKSLITLLFVVAFIPLFSQELLDIYKSGDVKLVPDLDYGKDNDWNTVFETYYDTIYNKPMGDRKSLKLLPDGSVVVNHEYRDYYSMFHPNGSFKKEFSLNSKPGVIQKHVYNIAGVINGNTFYSRLDNHGNMLCFDFDGNYKKKLKLDFMTKQMLPLSNGKIAVVGWVLWKEKIREFVSIVDYETNEQNDIWERFADRTIPSNENHQLFQYNYIFPGGGMMGFCSMPFIRKHGHDQSPQIATIGNNLMIAIPASGELLIYDANGSQVAKDKINWGKSYLSVEEQKEIQQKAIEGFKNRDMRKEVGFDPNNEDMVKFVAQQEKAKKVIIPQMEEDLKNISEPIPKPMLSTMIKDSDDNVLIFEFPEKDGQNKFNVWIYKDGGEFVGQSSFQCDDYDLQINPDKLVFHNGYLYGLQINKNVSGVPLRLVRFKLEREN